MHIYIYIYIYTHIYELTSTLESFPSSRTLKRAKPAGVSNNTNIVLILEQGGGRKKEGLGFKKIEGDG